MVCVAPPYLGCLISTTHPQRLPEVSHGLAPLGYSDLHTPALAVLFSPERLFLHAPFSAFQIWHIFRAQLNAMSFIKIHLLKMLAIL